MDNREKAAWIVQGILEDLRGRSGLQQAFEECDEEIQEEIINTWRDIAFKWVDAVG